MQVLVVSTVSEVLTSYLCVCLRLGDLKFFQTQRFGEGDMEEAHGCHSVTLGSDFGQGRDHLWLGHEGVEGKCSPVLLKGVVGDRH